MKGFFRWFKSSTKIKRWILIIIIGILLTCYGMAEVLTSDKQEFSNLGKIILIFVVGFVLVVWGIISIQKRTLEILVEETDERIDKNTKNVKSLIFNKKIYDQGPKIVAIGGGAGLNSVLKGLKKYTDNITAIVTVSDYGEKQNSSNGIAGSKVLDDIKQSIVALSENESVMEKLMNLNYSDPELKGLCFGDLYLLGMHEIYGDFAESIKNVQEVLNMTGRVLPVTLEPITICAELEDGTVIESKSKIPELVNDRVSKINRIYIKPTTCKPAPGVIEAIEEADAIVIGPGSLYTNVIPNLLVKGVAKAIKESKAFKIYVSNIMTEQGQTDNYTLSDHIKAINEHVGKGVIEYCIYDTGELIPEYIRKYNMQGQELVDIDAQKAKAEGVYLMQRELSYVDGEFIRHNPEAIATSIIQLICDDLKFKDMQNDTKYILLNDRLSQAKKNLKEEGKKKSKHKSRNIETGKSKFSKKYQDRIKSIQESDLKMKVKAGIYEEKTNEPKKSEEIKEKEKKKSKNKEKHTKKKNKK